MSLQLTPSRAAPPILGTWPCNNSISPMQNHLFTGSMPGPINMKSQKQLIANHLDQSIYWTNHEHMYHLEQSIYWTNQVHMLNCALTFASLSILSKNVEPY
jgi:hypothetical protein